MSQYKYFINVGNFMSHILNYTEIYNFTKNEMFPKIYLYEPKILV